uniref:OTU domain-containing protein n=1 Tax=Cannabis sativa TaxID=3483 RepID=A0A803PB10_CANSA
MYRLPLLEIVGVTSTEYTFSIAFVFLESKQEDNYTWALDRLKNMMDIDFLPNEVVTDRELALINAIEKVFQESKRGDWVGLDIHACGCVIRRTHGLPCAHEINEYQLEGRAIPLACINSYWRKLDLVKSTKNEANEISCDAEIELFLRRFQEIDIPTKLHLQRKLRELAKPSTTFLVDPEVKMNTHGRPPSKFDHSTCRDPSAFEYVSTKYSKSSISSNLNTKNKDVRLNTSQHSQSYLKSLPCELKSYIYFVKDVESDGNCGFRAIADLMAMVFMQNDSPIPPAATNWVRYRYSCAEEWKTPYEARMRAFRDLVGKEIATQETINLDTP